MAFPVPVRAELSEALIKDLPPAEYQIPTPQFSVWQRLLGQKPDQHVEKIKFMLNGAAAGMGRHPTQEEVNALSEITYKESRTVAWIMPIAFAVGGYMAWKGRATYKFPFYQPKFTKFSPEVFPSFRAPFINGQYANITWHNVRFISYGIVTGLLAAPLLGSYATSVAISTAARDDRLSQFRKDLKPGRLINLTADQMPLSALRAQRDQVTRAMREIEDNLATQRYLAEQKGTSDKAYETRPDFQRAEAKLQEYRIIFKQLDEAIARRNGEPTRIDETTQNQDYTALSASDSTDGQETYSSTRPDYRAPREIPASESRPGWGQQSSASQQGWGKADSDGLDSDDASPVAPAARPAAQSSSTGGVSAWDRLRQASKSPQKPSGNAWQGQQGQSEDAGASEKDRAQKEFDEMLERERQSEESQGGGRNRRW
ncbi:uncharacterized protein CTRU02_211091 [Colletotrichum truncatum]|uniref:Uncharacterized protein n=1 Tax=Colletotrichum truncatum TaxID=5467 RepID=A0ACC3YQS3_COLTU|nr:uncharacterized protein CTRU02_01869 [Colletotrichum truncatum]KAF6798998.1 hypothetical protein CTRU02_01869 [Colletotrichum truncatum]